MSPLRPVLSFLTLKSNGVAVPETKGLSLEELDQVFSVPTRKHASYHLKGVPYVARSLSCLLRGAWSFMPLPASGRLTRLAQLQLPQVHPATEVAAKGTPLSLGGPDVLGGLLGGIQQGYAIRTLSLSHFYAVVCLSSDFCSLIRNRRANRERNGMAMQRKHLIRLEDEARMMGFFFREHRGGMP